MKRTYLILAIIGFILPNIWVFKVSIDTGNILLYANPAATFYGAMANDISTAFFVDLIFIVLVFMVWSFREAKRFGIKNIGAYWILTMLFGIAGPFPLFLYKRESAKIVGN